MIEGASGTNWLRNEPVRKTGRVTENIMLSKTTKIRDIRA